MSTSQERNSNLPFFGSPPLRRLSSAVGLLRMRAGTALPAEKKRRRRGVAAILAMMFLIMFGSLSAAMAIASRGNITTAATHLHVMRAQSAAETGLSVAETRLREAASRFLMSHSDVTGDFGWDLWRGQLSGYSTYSVIPGRTGPQNAGAPSGIAQALAQAHAMDANVVAAIGINSVTIANAPTGTSTSVFRGSQWVYTPGVAIAPQETGTNPPPPLSYQITYAPLANGTDVRVIVTGYDFNYNRGGQPISRTISKDFRVTKRVNHALISPSRVMLGKNVQIIGDLGLRYDDIEFNNGDPLVTRSDFKNLDNGLDSKLDAFFDALKQNGADPDGDNRLRTNHPGESSALENVTEDYQSDTGTNDTPFEDVTNDGYVDEFDIFIKHFDANNDGRVAASEFTTGGGQLRDAELFNLIDSSDPDRNRNGRYGFIDANGNGRLDGTEPLVDVTGGENLDQILGYMDGYLDRRDRYVKMVGGLMFKTDKNDWESELGDVQDKIQGAIRPGSGNSPQTYNASDEDLPELSANNFVTDRNSLQAAANGQPFLTQIASPAAVPGFTAVAQTLSADANLDQLPDNHATAYFEKMPFNSPNFSDYYYRPVFRNIVFRDVEIPVGTNALFENCWFIGVTWVRTSPDNTHIMFGEYGKLKLDPSTNRPIPNIARRIYGDNAGETSYPTMLPSTATPPNQMILMANAPTYLDKGDIPANEVQYLQPTNGFGYNDLPEPLVVNGRRITDTKEISNNIRFHNCLFVGSIVSDSPNGYTQARNKIQFTGSTRFAQQHPDYPTSSQYNPQSADIDMIKRSSMMLPGYSVDIGAFNSPTTQNVALQGAVIAGVLDIRGNADINGALLLTFKPEFGEGPMVDITGQPVGNPASFNTTLGYFGPDDGDEESLDPNTLPIVNGQRIVGYDTNGDGLADAPATGPQPAGSTIVPFNGYGKVTLRWDPNMRLPNGIRLPMQFEPLSSTYREGR